MSDSILSKIKNRSKNTKKQSNRNTATYWVTPWVSKTSDGLYVGKDGSVWLYRELPLSPMLWEDTSTQLQVGSPLENLLYELAKTSSDRGTGMSSLSKSREVHLFCGTWDAFARTPEGTPEALADFLDPLMAFTSPKKALMIGVKLWQSSIGNMSGVKKSLSGLVDRIALDGGPDFSLYEDDIRVVKQILDRNQAHSVPTKESQAQLESWFNAGRGPHVEVYEYKDTIVVDALDRIEIAAVMDFEETSFRAPNAPWASMAQTHSSPAQIVSVRGQLDPPSVGRSRIRRSERKLKAALEEEAHTADLDRPELSATLDLAEEVERLIVTGKEPLLSNCSIILARTVHEGTAETYIDELSDEFGIEAIPLVHRQIDALEETLPASSRRNNPFLQDVTIPMLAHAGFQSFSNLGDRSGLWCGLVDPEGSLCYLHPMGAPAANKPAMTLIAGRSGSGKTFLATLLAVQAAIAGQQVVFINPKSDDSLAGMLNLVPSGRVVKLTEIEEEGGYFDPFSYCEDPQKAVLIAQNHILTVLGSRASSGGFTVEEELTLTEGLRTAANANVQCVGHALEFVEKVDPVHGPKVKKMILQQANDPLFRLGIAFSPRKRDLTDRPLLLIEFDKPLQFPEGSNPAEYNRAEKLAVAAIQLVTRTASEMLAKANGGVLIVDEAWMFLKSAEGAGAIQSLGRLGRSQNILPILITQKVKDFVDGGADVEEHLSRVFAMALADEKEATAALQLCQLKPTRTRLNFLRDAGPVKPEPGQIGRPAMALHRDLNNRHAAVVLGPWPDWIRSEISTNPEDKQHRLNSLSATASTRPLNDIVTQQPHPVPPPVASPPAAEGWTEV